jgi:hypothetical protein
MRRILIAGTATALVATGAIVAQLDSSRDTQPSASALSGSCAPGFVTISSVAREVVAEMTREGESAQAAEMQLEMAEAGAGVETELTAELARELPQSAQVDTADWDSWCVPVKRPESLNELAGLAIPRMAPLPNGYQPGAFAAAVRERDAMAAGSVAGTSGTGRLYGRGPLIVNDKRYDEVNGLGLVENSGRIDSFAWDPRGNRLFAAVGTGGIWYTDDLANPDAVPTDNPTESLRWRNATGNLPTTVTGAVEWTRARNGTLLALTGDPTFGSNAFTGIGAYWSSDKGKNWHRAKGVPNGGLGFQLAVDPADPSTVYAATQMGLFRSTDAGRSYRNVKLPTGAVQEGGESCAGVTDFNQRPECALASIVTDVVVLEPGGVGTDTEEHTVVATVGWRGGNRPNATDVDQANESVQSPNNGVYRSASGRPGTFQKLEMTGFVGEQKNIGRIELGPAVGADQDHDYLYAIIQDAELLNDGGVLGIDVPDTSESEDIVKEPLGTTVLNGIYVSADFGQSWTLMAKGTEIASNLASGSALNGTGTALGFQPGVQAWYNLHIRPDPTKTAPGTSIPSRLIFGLEEVWANDPAITQDTQPLNGKTTFSVVGKYFAGESCLLLRLGLPACPGDREPGPIDPKNLTTHPDQQDAIWVVDEDVDGGRQLVVGNDGGAYRYRFETDGDDKLDNANWFEGDNDGFSTLLPYFASVAEDGTVWAGLQDNGNLRVDPTTRRQFETYGGDGFFTAVDPDDSKTSYEEYVAAAMSVTEDGGRSWRSIDPGLTAPKFNNPFAMDPLDSDHLVTAGREVVETLEGPQTSSGMGEGTQWRKVYDLGTKTQHGDPEAVSSTTDPNNSMSAIDVVGDAVYVAYCGNCDTLNKSRPKDRLFTNGIATNVGGAEPRESGTSQGWHHFRRFKTDQPNKMYGLPNRYITSIAVDPKRPRTVFAALGGYTRRWLPAGATGDENLDIGTGHLYRSTDAGKHWKDVTGNLPDAPATWVEVRGGQLLVGTDVGAFASNMKGTTADRPRFAPLEKIPAVPVSSIQLQPGSTHRVVVATYGRGIWTYNFENAVSPPQPSDDPDERPVRVGEVYKKYTFERGPSGWTTGPPEDPTGLPTPWVYEPPGEGENGETDDAGKSWGIDGTDYNDKQDSVLVSPAIATEAGPSAIQFGLLLDTEAGFDQVTVQFRAADDPTGNWRSLGSYSGRFPEYPKWATVGVPFDSPGGDVQIRFRFITDEICSNNIAPNPVCANPEGFEGVRVDNVKVGKPAT